MNTSSLKNTILTFMRKIDFREYFGVALVCFLAVVVTNLLFGAPFFSPDSWGYLDVSKDQLGFGAWHPAGFPIIIKILTFLGFTPAGIVNFNGGLLCFVLYILARKMMNFRMALLTLSYFLLSPQWIMLRGTFWTEVPLMLFCLLIAIVISIQSNWLIRAIGAILFWIIAIETRHAGFFILPGICFGLAFIKSHDGKWRFSFKYLAAGAVLAMSFWSLSNFLKTGSQSGQTSSTRPCNHLLVAMNGLPYCDWDPTLAVCKYDPERKWLNPAIGDGVAVLGSMESSSETPQIALENTEGAQAVCQTTNKVIRLAITEHPFMLISMLTDRVYRHFGSWEIAELWVSPTRETAHVADSGSGRPWLLSEILRVTNSFQFLYVVVLVAALGCLVFYFPGSPVGFFLLFAGLGHAYGIAAANPWLALRYMAISKLLVLLALLKFGYDIWLIKRNKKENTENPVKNAV